MAYPRVNLIHRNEKRHQGAVSRRFLFISIVVTPVLLIAIFSGVNLIQYGTIRSEIEVKDELWTDLEPRLKLFKQEQKELKANQQMLMMLDAWKASQYSFSTVLIDIQKRIPENIQLTRMSVQSGMAAAVYPDVASLGMEFDLVLQGSSYGERAEDAVIDLRKDLFTSESVASAFGSVKLASMRKRTTAAGENYRTFSLEGSKE